MKQTGISYTHLFADAGYNMFSCIKSAASPGFKSLDSFCMYMHILSETVVFKVFSSVEIAMFSTLNYILKEKTYVY